MKIGIPKALIYWKKPYFFEIFFKALGFEVLLSPNTNKEIVEIGVKCADPETCYSIKVYFGHLKWLDKKCDLIFVPRFKKNELGFEYCPKFFALPDLAKISLKTKILTEKYEGKFEKFLLKLGKKLKKNRKEIFEAKEIAILKEKEFFDERFKLFEEKIKSQRKKIFLISHPYNLYDEFVNFRIKERLEKEGVEVILIEDVFLEEKLPFPYNIHWEFGREIILKIDKILKFKISGAIQISSFACGCDAVLKEFVEKKFKESKIPYLYLIVDEQTGEAGFQTRLEAFLDTII